MKKNIFITSAACCALLVPSFKANAQEETVVVEESAVVTDIPCKTRYYVDSHDNWFIQFGAGVATPFVEGKNAKGDRSRQYTVNYNVGFGKWFSPYMGWRLAFNGGPLHYTIGDQMHKIRYVGANLDFMWDMFNSLGGVKADRVFSIVPFVGLGGTFTWDYRPLGEIEGNHGPKHTSWTLPVSAGLQLRFRLCKSVDFFAEARSSFYGDNFNNIAIGRPIDINLTVNGGFAITFGGRDYKSYNPCDYLGYVDNLNNQVNELRGALATTAAALSAAESQLPCPEVAEISETVVESAPMMASVRFTINSARISNEEMVNVFNVSEWMKQNPGQNVAIVGYADRETGTSAYNMALSKRRAQAVYDALVNKYGINPERLAIQAEGSDTQPYDVNNWNRIVIFSAK